MKSKSATLVDIRRRGLHALAKELGPAGMIRFLRQFQIEKGDYSKDRHALLNGVSFEQVTAQIKSSRGKRK